MSQIKFRAWDKTRKEMGNVASIEWDTDRSIKRALLVFGVDPTVADVDVIWVDGSDLELIRFTGLHDQKNNEIYEGDRLKSLRSGIKYTVEWREKEFMALNDSGHLALENWSDALIIGNIYENPELLK